MAVILSLWEKNPTKQPKRKQTTPPTYFFWKIKNHVCGINSLGGKNATCLHSEVLSHAEMLHQIEVISVKLNTAEDISRAS